MHHAGLYLSLLPGFLNADMLYTIMHGIPSITHTVHSIMHITRIALCISPCSVIYTIYVMPNRHNIMRSMSNKSRGPALQPPSPCTGGQDAQVGLVHNYMNYEPYTNTWAARLYLQPVCNTMQYIWGTEVILKYFQTGKFVWQAPVGSKVDFDEGSKPGLDFIGMNYYGRYC